MQGIELLCPFCAGRFEAEPAGVSRAMACPHCGRPVATPATPPAPPPPPTMAVQIPAPAPESDEEVSAEPAKRELPAAPASPFAVREPARSIVNRRGEAIPLRRRSIGERDRYRRRLNFVFAAAGLVVLAIVLAVLLHVRP